MQGRKVASPLRDRNHTFMLALLALWRRNSVHRAEPPSRRAAEPPSRRAVASRVYP
jgi:hypothetical protein